jgi:oligosaccharyltransferase complex subunit alpha (ribophorin I)
VTLDLRPRGSSPKCSDIQYYRITLPKPLAPKEQQTLGISFIYTKAYVPLPASVAQDETQYLVYDFSAYCPSVYPTSKQKTEVKCHSSNIPDYTKVPGTAGVEEFPQKQGSKLTYGPFGETQAGAVLPVRVRFEFAKPVTHMSVLERDIEISHWGGNIAFEERYTMHNRGANLSTLFNRVKWAQSQYYNPNTHALKEMKFQLRGGSVDPYYTDAIGNVSTSRFRSNEKHAVLEIKPRYPVFGGWKYPFTIGWNSDAKNFLRKTKQGGFVLNVPFMEGPRQPEGVEYEQVNVRILLPEGAEYVRSQLSIIYYVLTCCRRRNVKFHTTIPESSITEHSVQIQKSYLDTIGRTALIIKARNLVDEFRDRDLVVSYDYPFLASLRKPLVVFASMVGVFVAAWILGGVEVKFSIKK